MAMSHRRHSSKRFILDYARLLFLFLSLSLSFFFCFDLAMRLECQRFHFTNTVFALHRTKLCAEHSHRNTNYAIYCFLMKHLMLSTCSYSLRIPWMKIISAVQRMYSKKSVANVWDEPNCQRSFCGNGEFQYFAAILPFNLNLFFQHFHYSVTRAFWKCFGMHDKI